MHLISEGSMNNIGFNHQVLVDELSWIGVVSVDAAHTTGSYEHELRPLALEEAVYIHLLGEIEFGVCASDDIVVADGLKAAYNSGPSESAMSSNKDRAIEFHIEESAAVYVIKQILSRMSIFKEKTFKSCLQNE